MIEESHKEIKFKFRNEKQLTSNILRALILTAFLIYFTLLEWYWLTVIYIFIGGYLLTSYYKTKRVIEVIVTGDQIEFLFIQNIKTQTVQYNLTDLSVEKKRNPAFKFSKVYDLIILSGSEKLFIIHGANESSTDDIEDLNSLLTAANKTFPQ